MNLRRNRERGVALLMVLWMLALMAAIAVVMATTARTESRLARNLVEEVRARAAAQAGVSHAILMLLDPKAKRRPGPDGDETLTVDVLGSKVNLSIRDECGKVDINTGWGTLLLGLVRQYTGDEQAQALSQAILDWRDPDHRRRPRGAEDDDYATAHRVHGARDGLFETVDELQQVLGMSPGLYARLAPDITIDCLNAGVDPASAARAVLAAIPGVEPLELETFLRARGAAQNGQLPELDGGEEYTETSPAQVFGIRAVAELASGARGAWQAVVWITEDPSRPFLLRAWRQIGGENP
ncbi:MAG: general secretion pathway protein GspK [Rhodospirillales bacterium]|nr:general secretion pathway protein GspK [Rhodospirillales bacterium]